MSDRLRILCFGNSLHGDDGFGPALYRRLMDSALPAGVVAIEAGTRGLDALPFFEHCPHLILADAMAGTVAGRIRRLTPDTLPLDMQKPGSHGGGLPLLLAAMAAVIGTPPRIDIIAAELTRIAPFSPGLSAPMRAAVEESLEIITATITATPGDFRHAGA